MTTKLPPKIREENMTEPIKKIYVMVNELNDIIPVMNDRNRVGYCLYKYFKGEASSVKEALRSANPESCTLDRKELEKIISKKYSELDLNSN